MRLARLGALLNTVVSVSSYIEQSRRYIDLIRSFSPHYTHRASSLTMYFVTGLASGAVLNM